MGSRQSSAEVLIRQGPILPGLYRRADEHSRIPHLRPRPEPCALALRKLAFPCGTGDAANPHEPGRPLQVHDQRAALSARDIPHDLDLPRPPDGREKCSRQS